MLVLVLQQVALCSAFALVTAFGAHLQGDDYRIHPVLRVAYLVCMAAALLLALRILRRALPAVYRAVRRAWRAIASVGVPLAAVFRLAAIAALTAVACLLASGYAHDLGILWHGGVPHDLAYIDETGFAFMGGANTRTIRGLLFSTFVILDIATVFVCLVLMQWRDERRRLAIVRRAARRA